MKYRIVAPKDGNPRTKPEVIGEIEGDDVRFSGGAGTVSGPSVHQLITLLGNGFGSRTFHIETDDVLLTNCTVVRQLATLSFGYTGTQPRPGG